MAKLVSKVYGDALFSLAVEENKLDAIWDEVKAVRQAITENQEFLGVMCHPLPQAKRLEMLEAIFGGQSDDMKGFLNVLVHKGRFGEILSILDYFDEQAKEYKRIGVVNVATPLPLNDNQKTEIENRLLQVTEYETLEMHYQIDQSLLGGMVVRIGDRILDNSIRSKIDAMSRQLSKVKIVR
jgi:F-type H+-transporting ATPase subunit delta